MNARTEKALSGLTMAVLMFAWVGIFLLVYYVPILTTEWNVTGAELSSAQQLLIAVGSLASRNILVAGPLLLVVTVAATVWRVLAIRKVRRLRRAS
ncbi:MAG: hypothetical protein ACYTAS_16615 [Planctomycetota bacterium]|jgi:type II secretory pathway component PulF